MQLRPPAPEDADAVLAVIAARDVADIGYPDIELADITGEWASPSLDMRRDCFVAVDDDGAIVGYASIERRGAMVAVHPDAEGRGIGTALREAVEARAAERREPPRQIVQPANAGSVEHLRAAGYERLYVHQRMRIELAGLAPSTADGVRRFDLDAEGEAVHALMGDAFAEIDGSVTEPLDGWRSVIAHRSSPQFRLVVEDADGLAGAVIGERWSEGIGYVARIAVARRARGRGHGRALLLALLEAFRADGLEAAEIDVAGANVPATGLYESVGMRPAFRQERWGRL